MHRTPYLITLSVWHRIVIPLVTRPPGPICVSASKMKWLRWVDVFGNCQSMWSTGRLGDAGTPADLCREVTLQLVDALTPIGRSLLTDQLNVKEWSLAGTVQFSRRRTTHDTRRHVCHKVLKQPQTPLIITETTTDAVNNHWNNHRHC